MVINSCILLILNELMKLSQTLKIGIPVLVVFIGTVIFTIVIKNKTDKARKEFYKNYVPPKKIRKVAAKDINDPVANQVYIKMREALKKEKELEDLAAANDYDRLNSYDQVYSNLQFFSRSSPSPTTIVLNNLSSRDAVMMVSGHDLSFKGFWGVYVKSGEYIEVRVPGETCALSFLLGRRWSENFKLADSVYDVVGGEKGLYGFFLSPAPGAAELISEAILLTDGYSESVESSRIILGNNNGQPGYEFKLAYSRYRFMIQLTEPGFVPETDSIHTDSVIQ